MTETFELVEVEGAGFVRKLWFIDTGLPYPTSAVASPPLQIEPASPPIRPARTPTE